MTGDAGMVDATDAGAPPSPQRLAARPPTWLFHGLLAIATLPVLWAVSVPGSSTTWLLVSLLVWFWFGAVWLVRLALYVTHRRRLSWWFAVAPAMFVLLVSVVNADLPLKVRWAGSHDAFEAAVAGLPADEELSLQPKTIGSFRISETLRIPEGVLFYEAHGAFLFNDAGFAYLPDGPSDDIGDGALESPEFRPLGGPWYAWTASW
jgi:hypothetical protein